MKTFVSFVASLLMLNLSVNADSSSAKKKKNPNQEMKKQKMEEPSSGTVKRKKYPGFETNPRPYAPDSTPQERIQTED